MNQDIENRLADWLTKAGVEEVHAGELQAIIDAVDEAAFRRGQANMQEQFREMLGT